MSCVDRLVAGGGVFQALLTRWGTVTALDMALEEIASDVNGQRTLDQRWRRGVGLGSLWLGPALHARLDKAALAALKGEAVADASRLRIDDVAPAEALLAPLLASPEDWLRGMNTRYASALRMGDTGIESHPP